MKVLIQHAKNLLYVTEQGDWVSNAADAHNFANSVAALEYIDKRRLKHVHLVLKFPNANYDITLPIDEPQTGTSRDRL